MASEINKKTLFKPEFWWFSFANPHSSLFLKYIKFCITNALLFWAPFCAYSTFINVALSFCPACSSLSDTFSTFSLSTFIPNSDATNTATTNTYTYTQRVVQSHLTRLTSVKRLVDMQHWRVVQKLWPCCLLNMTQLFLSLSHTHTHTHLHTHEQREIKVSILLYICNGVMNYGCAAPLSLVKVEKAIQCQLMCHISERGGRGFFTFT